MDKQEQYIKVKAEVIDLKSKTSFDVEPVKNGHNKQSRKAEYSDNLTITGLNSRGNEYFAKVVNDPETMALLLTKVKALSLKDAKALKVLGDKEAQDFINDKTKIIN